MCVCVSGILMIHQQSKWPCYTAQVVLEQLDQVIGKLGNQKVVITLW